MSRLKHVKKLAGLILILGLVITLVSCNKSDKVPYGDIGDNTYLTVGDNVEITERELYDGLRKQSASTIASMFDKHLFKDEIAVVDKLLSEDSLSTEDEEHLTRDEAIEEFDTLVKEFIFSKATDEQIEKMSELRKQVAIEKYVDSLYLLDNNIDRDAINLEITTKLNEEEPKFFEVEFLAKNYKLRIAQRLYAIKQLKEEVLDEESDVYIEDLDVINYYKNNVRNRHDIEAFIFNFRHVSEATAVLRELNLKADGAGNWYEIPNLEDTAVATAIQTDDASYAHVKTLLEDLSIPVTVGYEYTTKDVVKFYDAYSPNKNRDKDGDPDVALGLAEVKNLFVEAYNMVNANKEIEIVNDEIVYKNGDDFNTTYTYEDLGDLGSGIRSYVYDSLFVDDVDKKSYSSLRASGASRYLIIKLGEEEQTDLIHEEKDEDENDQWIEDLTTAQEELIAGYREELIETKLTQEYISSKVNEVHEEQEIEIFDSIIRSNYEDSYEYDGTTKNKDGNVVAKLGELEITARDLYTEMEKSFGVNLALDLAINEVLLENKDEVLTDDDYKEFEKEFRDLLNNFSNDQFAQAGFPASVGRAKFLMSIFGATSNKEAIELGFVIPKLREKFSLDYESHYDDIYTKLATLTNTQYNNFKSVTVSHLLVYFDANGDGTPDNPQEYLDSLDPVKQAIVKQGIVELMNGNSDVDGIFEELSSDGDISSIKGGLGLLAGEVNDAGRVPLINNTRSKWNEFASLGLHTKFEELGEITNTSNFITGNSTLDEVFYDRAMTLHDRIAHNFDEAKSDLNYLDFYGKNSLEAKDENGDVMHNELLDESKLDLIMSDFGFHFILVTGIGSQEHFDYDESDDRNDNYTVTINKGETDEKTLNIYNDNSEISASQIEYYILGKDEEEGAALPTSVNKAFTKHFDPVFTRYNENQHMQRELFFKTLSDLGVKLHDVDGNEITSSTRFETIREINKRQFFDYINEKGSLLYDENYETLYGDWFDVLEG